MKGLPKNEKEADISTLQCLIHNGDRYWQTQQKLKLVKNPKCVDITCGGGCGLQEKLSQ